MRILYVIFKIIFYRIIQIQNCGLKYYIVPQFRIYDLSIYRTSFKEVQEEKIYSYYWIRVENLNIPPTYSWNSYQKVLSWVENKFAFCLTKLNDFSHSLNIWIYISLFVPHTNAQFICNKVKENTYWSGILFLQD